MEMQGAAGMADETGAGGQSADTKGPDAPLAAPPPGADNSAVTGANFLAQPIADEADDWSPPRMAPDGIALDGDGLPINRRLRALALADRGEETDPAGEVAPADIADARKRIQEHEERVPPIPKNATQEDLEARAKLEGVDISTATKNAERRRLILAARPPLV
jgi:hypothetical protein